MGKLDFSLYVIENKETNKKKTLEGLMKEGYYLISNFKNIMLMRRRKWRKGKWKVLAHWRPWQLSG